MARKIPTDAFDVYFSLGTARSYEAIARRYGVSKKAVTLMAKRERWQERLRNLEAKARESSAARQVEALQEETERQLKVLRFLEAKALEALRSMPIASVPDAIRAIDVVFRNRRAKSGESKGADPRPVINVLQVTPEEYARRKRNLNAAALLANDTASHGEPKLLDILRQGGY